MTTKEDYAYWRGWNNGYACAMEDNAKISVVMCKDCKFYHSNKTKNGSGRCEWVPYPPVKDSHFCGWGERRENG